MAINSTPEAVSQRLIRPDQATLNKVVNLLMFGNIHNWPDGNVFRILATLNSIGIRTTYSCEGGNPNHRVVYNERIGMPIICINERCQYLDDKLGNNGLSIQEIAEIIAQMIDTFNMTRKENKFELVLIPEGNERILTLSRVNKNDSSNFTSEDHQSAITVLHEFNAWIEANFFHDAVSFEAAMQVNLGDPADYTHLDVALIPLGFSQPNTVDPVAREYTLKGMQVTVGQLVNRTIRDYEESQDEASD